MIELSNDHIDAFTRDGFVIVENALDAKDIAAAQARFEPLFSGEFETGLQPDEWNWRAGRDSEQLTRQICNGWKADRTVAAVVLRQDVGKACATLRGWPGARCRASTSGSVSARTVHWLARVGKSALDIESAPASLPPSASRIFFTMRAFCAALTSTVASTMRHGAPCSWAMRINAVVSFGKQEPP